eukprot:m.63295 g.63295  ORF g.63295 m.63295 type:complete len:186 (+) comp13438_c0_seq2:63-620(+)
MASPDEGSVVVAAAPPVFAAPSAPRVAVAQVDDVPRGRGVAVTVHGREVVVFRVPSQKQRQGLGDTWYALDRHCYHAGGPLDLGDIEDMDGPCVKCPWHQYTISLATGAAVYQALDDGCSGAAAAAQERRYVVKAKGGGPHQRTHHCVVENGTVYVTLSEGPESCKSDYYSSDEFHTIMGKNKQP